MVYLGFNGYKEQAMHVFKAVKKVKEAIMEIEELDVIGDPEICVVAFRSIEKKLNIFAVHQVMSKKGWNLTVLQEPGSI